LRPLIVSGYAKLNSFPKLRRLLSLDDLFLAVLLAANTLGVRLRPELGRSEAFASEDIIAAALAEGAGDDEDALHFLMTKMRSEQPPHALLDDVVKTVQDPFLGLEALALASICEQSDLTPKLAALPNIPSIAETAEAKAELVRAWLRLWRNHGFWLARMPQAWWKRPKKQGVSVTGKKGKGSFESLATILVDKAARKIFNDQWSPQLLRLFCDDMGGEWRLRGAQLSLKFDGDWVRCAVCKSVHRPVSSISHCLDCGSQRAVALDPDNDAVYHARKGYYRRSTVAALAVPPREPMALIAAEHTAQLNAPQNEDIFSKAELNELLFQDIDPTIGRSSRATAIDVLSSTTTMEVGIDIGALSGVALRNMPPGRANYQQRAGRAGRRGNAVATVLAFGSADSHDEHYFTHPKTMIAGDVIDPRLTLDNRDIARRHIRAFLLQNYHQHRIPHIDPEQPHDLFSVLGTVTGFRDGTSVLNEADFESWLRQHEERLRKRIASWIPEELSGEDRAALLHGMVADCLKAVDEAIRYAPNERPSSDKDEEASEEAPEPDEERPTLAEDSASLLDRLLYRGVLPRYAFPTDVATFHVFDRSRSSRFRAIMRYAPSQGLPIALSQYAPGKQIWIAGMCYTSGAIYSPLPEERFDAWTAKRRLYRECSACEFAQTVAIGSAAPGEVSDCPACGATATFGPTRSWLRPPGFAHPQDVPEVTSPDDMPETSYATRAKLTMPSPSDENRWHHVNERIRVLKERQHLLVSNTGPKKDGYSYCTKCGRIESETEQTPTLFAAHPKPYVDEKEPTCAGASTARHIVLGTDFITDIALFSLSVAPPVTLRPGTFPTTVALRTVSEALAKAACQILEIETAELLAEYRPAITKDDTGRDGLLAEIFLYDTLAGGAGFSSQLLHRGEEFFGRALTLMKECPEQCDASCYRCLRSFKNKFEHALLDRHVGAELLEYLLTGQVPDFDPQRMEKSTKLLFDDLSRQAPTGVRFERHGVVRKQHGHVLKAPILAIRADGTQIAIALSGPLTPQHPANSDWLQLASAPELLLVNELLVRSNLPAATRQVQQRIG
jgi:Domain of unknown function (DUF1998)/Helicase conserved C-terminal domain